MTNDSLRLLSSRNLGAVEINPCLLQKRELCLVVGSMSDEETSAISNSTAGKWLIGGKTVVRHLPGLPKPAKAAKRIFRAADQANQA